MNRNNREERNGGGWSWAGIAGAAAGLTALARGIVYLATYPQTEDTSETSERERTAISRSEIRDNPVINNRNALLADIYVRYVALKEQDFRLHYKVFTQVFNRLHRVMKEVDQYYERYSSNVQFAGSHSDRLRIKKPDEFDMDIVIGLPVNLRINSINPSESDIVLEPKYAGFVELRAGVQYQNIMMRDGQDSIINKTAYKWMDNRHYILRSKFTDWFKSVGTRALNKFERRGNLPGMLIDNVWYSIGTSSSGPAWTIVIQANGFRLDVDLVPALKFPEARWDLGKDYRKIPTGCERDYWMVVPKPNKNGQNSYDEKRSWRIALQDQEKQLMYNCYQLKQAIRMMKKLRDELGMHKIASYYIKTLFFWEIEEKRLDPGYWKRNNLEDILKHMLGKLHLALNNGVIPYYWNKNLNLINGLYSSTLFEYKNKIQAVIERFDNNTNCTNYKLVAKYFLSPNEFQEYRRILNI